MCKYGLDYYYFESWKVIQDQSDSQNKNYKMFVKFDTENEISIYYYGHTDKIKLITGSVSPCYERDNFEKLKKHYCTFIIDFMLKSISKDNGNLNVIKKLEKENEYLRKQIKLYPESQFILNDIKEHFDNLKK